MGCYRLWFCEITLPLSFEQVNNRLTWKTFVLNVKDAMRNPKIWSHNSTKCLLTPKTNSKAWRLEAYLKLSYMPPCHWFDEMKEEGTSIACPLWIVFFKNCKIVIFSWYVHFCCTFTRFGIAVATSFSIPLIGVFEAWVHSDRKLSLQLHFPLRFRVLLIKCYAHI